MKQTDRAEKHLDLLLQRYPILTVQKEEIRKAYQVMAAAYEAGGKLLIAGNGGSAADAEHIVGELMKRFKKPRKLDAALAERLLQESPELGPELVQNLQKALPAIALDGHLALSTAYANDCAPLMCFAQQVNGYGKAGDVLLAISTSGKSKNILYASVTARAIGMKVIGLTGAADSPLIPLCDVCIRAPLLETYQIQELHLPIYHCLCLMLEEHFFASKYIFSEHEAVAKYSARHFDDITRYNAPEKRFAKNAQPAPVRCSSRVWDFPTSILNLGFEKSNSKIASWYQLALLAANANAF